MNESPRYFTAGSPARAKPNVHRLIPGNAEMLEPSWLLEILRCPETRAQLLQTGDHLARPDGRTFPIVQGIPRLVHPQTSLGEDARWQRFYDRFAPVYELNERVFGRLLLGLNMVTERTRIVSLLGLQRGMATLEVSPGPGVYQHDIRAAIGDGARFAAIDLSFGMLCQCQKRNRALNVALVQANGSHLPFADESFDALFHFGSVNLFDEPEQAIAEFVRVVRNGGIVSWGDERLPASAPGGWRKLFLTRMNPGYLRQPPPIPVRLRNVRQYEVFGGYGYLVVATR